MSLVLAALIWSGPAPVATERSLDPSSPTAVVAPDVEMPTPADVPGGDATEDEDDLTASPSPSRPAPAAAPPRVRIEQAPSKRPGPDRRGPLLAVGAGVGSCAQDECNGLRAAGWFTATGGYRFGRVAPIVALHAGVGSVDTPAAITIDEDEFELRNASDARRFYYAAAGVMLHFLERTIFDPYTGLTLGYFSSGARVRADYVGVDESFRGDVRAVTHRGALGVIVGLGFRIRKRFVLGPRFDAIVPFAGKWCVRDDVDRVCTAFSRIESIDTGQFFPRPWAVTLQFGAVL